MGEHHADETREFAVASDEPVLLRSPRRRLQSIAVAYSLAIIVCAGAAGYIGYHLGAGHTDRRIAVLERDLSERRAANQRANADRDRQIATIRGLLCTLLDHSQPRDEQIEQLRRQYSCTGGPYPLPPAWPTPSPTPTVSPAPPRTSSDGTVTPSTTRSMLRPQPTPAPSPSRGGVGPIICIRLPIVGDVCV